MVFIDQEETSTMMNAQKDASRSSPTSSISSSPPSSLSPLNLLKKFSKSFDESITPLVVGWSDSSVQKISPEGKRQSVYLLPIAIVAWYIVGVVSIVTTKVLLTDWQVPPLVVTFQQLSSGSCVLWLYLLVFQGGAQPWPWDNMKGNKSSSSLCIDVAPVDTTAIVGKTPMRHYDFILAGLFNALDFLASNTAFSQSAASFVETVKASEPITTTAGKLVGWVVLQYTCTKM
jgi:hypothetical protein